MRTDSTKYSKDFVKSAKKYIKNNMVMIMLHENIELN